MTVYIRGPERGCVSHLAPKFPLTPREKESNFVVWILQSSGGPTRVPWVVVKGVQNRVSSTNYVDDFISALT